MSNVNAVNAYSQIPFKAAEGQPSSSSSSSSPIVPAFLVGAATLGGVKMFAPGPTLEKGMDQDTFYSTLKEGKDVPFKKELEGEQKTAYENAKTAAKADAAADAGKTVAKAATEGADAAKKEVPEFAKKAYESLKDVKLKSSWMKAGLWGLGGLAATYIVAKMAGGGSKTEQA